MSIDTLQVHQDLISSGLSSEQADAIVRGLRASEQTGVTEAKLQSELAPIRTDLLQLKWMVGLILGGIATLVLKTFFHG